MENGPTNSGSWWKRLLLRRPVVSESPHVKEELFPQLTVGDRAYPPVSLADTVMSATKRDGPNRALHDARGVLFISDEEVLRVHANHNQWEFRGQRQLPPVLDIGGQSAGKFFFNTRNGVVVPVYRSNEGGVVRHTIPQQAHRSCPYTAASMIMLDACSRESIRTLNSRRLLDDIVDGNLGNSSIAKSLMSHAVSGKLTPSIITLPFFRNDVIANALDTHGPAYASIGGEIGGHVIVLDSVSNRTSPNPVVRIRDSFHGWDIDVRLSSLTKRGLDRELLVCSRVRSGDNRDRDV